MTRKSTMSPTAAAKVAAVETLSDLLPLDGASIDALEAASLPELVSALCAALEAYEGALQAIPHPEVQKACYDVVAAALEEDEDDAEKAEAAAVTTLRKLFDADNAAEDKASLKTVEGRVIDAK